MKLSAPLSITLDDLETGINNEENSGICLDRDGLSISDDGTLNLIFMSGGAVPVSPIQLRRLGTAVGNDAAAQQEINNLHARLAPQTGGVWAWGELSIQNQRCYVAAIRDSGIATPPGTQAAASPFKAGMVINKPGWAFSAQIFAGPNGTLDFVVPNGKATWFGGPHDSQDSGETASGVNTRTHPDILGCALPLDESNSKHTDGSPIPRLRWGTLVEVTCLDTQQSITVPLIDLGPQRATKKAIDLTERAFESLGVPASKGVMNVSFTIRNLAASLHPKSHFALPSASLLKPLDGQNEKILPVASTPEAHSLGALIDSLRLPNFTGREILETLDRSRSNVKNSHPPANLHTHIIPTLCVLQKLRTELGFSLHPTSTYRSQAYNRAVGGATQSQHLVFRAIDFQWGDDNTTPARIAQRLDALRGQSIPVPIALDPALYPGLNVQPAAGGGSTFTFRGGIGIYSSFVHVDTRGNNADWS